MIGIILDSILGYYGISSLISFSYLLIYKNLKNIVILGLIMNLLYINYYTIYLIIFYFIINYIYKFINKNIIIDLLLLYLIVLLYYIITCKLNKYIYIYSIIPCIFYLSYHIIKYVKKIFSYYNNNIMYFNRSKNKSKI